MQGSAGRRQIDFGVDVMKRFRGLTCLTLLVAFVFLLAADAFCDDAPGRTIDMKITYGMKQRTEREFTILASPSIKTREGTKASISVENLEDKRGFKIEVTPSIGTDNPELMILVIKAWELREITKDGKQVTEYVPIMDQTSRVSRGATMFYSERAGIDRDIQVTITPYYKISQ